ncbi:hypothetical protein R1flu_018725 [Riccia fluitans]|uniref:Uncharacterized protein n=1 Tax=Riccia fluitans TaxID=41844 RepID=A0ABD1ZGN1_9MARC
MKVEETTTATGGRELPLALLLPALPVACLTCCTLALACLGIAGRASREVNNRNKGKGNSSLTTSDLIVYAVCLRGFRLRCRSEVDTLALNAFLLFLLLPAIRERKERGKRGS